MVWYQIQVNPREDKEAFAAFLVINPFYFKQFINTIISFDFLFTIIK